MIRLVACVFTALLLAACAPTERAAADGVAPGETFRDCADCPQMVVVPAGSFLMGEPLLDVFAEPQHRVHIDRPFAVGRFEVSFAEWDACLADGGCEGYKPSDAGWGRGDLPVMNLSWQEAKAYTVWLSRRTGKPYRLLSEAEWEYVAGAGYSPGAARCAEIAPTVTGDGQLLGATRPVGTCPANAFGVHEMLDNVSEWVEDCWHDSYQGAPDDGSAWTQDGACLKRVMRGGAWPQFLHPAQRRWNHTGYRLRSLGFRVALSLEP